MKVEFLIITGTLLMLLLAFFIIMFVNLHQKRMLQNQFLLQNTKLNFQEQLIEATLITEQKEREKIARNLHDDIGTSLNIVRLQIEKTKRQNANNTELSNALEKSLGAIGETIHSIRNISKSLLPVTLEKVGWTQALKEFCSSINDTGVCNVSFIDNGKPFLKDFSLQAHAYRIIQEVFNNLLKHAKPSAITLLLDYKENQHLIVFSYNGTGINDAEITILYQQNKGVGLKSIESRLKILNGTINYKTLPNEINISIPE